MMKSTDIPNGYVVRGPSGNNILVDFDDKGKPENKACEIVIKGWPVDVMTPTNQVRPEVLVLVHTVRGEEEILVKRLFASRLELEGKPITVEEIARKGMLNKVAENIWKTYVAKMEQAHRLQDQIKAAEESK